MIFSFSYIKILDHNIHFSSHYSPPNLLLPSPEGTARRAGWWEVEVEVSNEWWSDETVRRGTERITLVGSSYPFPRVILAPLVIPREWPEGSTQPWFTFLSSSYFRFHLQFLPERSGGTTPWKGPKDHERREWQTVTRPEWSETGPILAAPTALWREQSDPVTFNKVKIIISIFHNSYSFNIGI